jgi:hypothetical protein
MCGVRKLVMKLTSYTGNVTDLIKTQGRLCKYQHGNKEALQLEHGNKERIKMAEMGALGTEGCANVRCYSLEGVRSLPRP